MIYLQLFFEFLKVGLFTVGGGLASIPFLYQIAERYPWFTAADVVDMIAISESTPGAIGVNMATYAGYTTAGVLGSIVATAGIILPEIIIVLLVAKFLHDFQDNRFVLAAFYGIRPAVTALISVACFSVLKISVLNWNVFTQSYDFTQLFNLPALILFAVTLFLVFKFKKHPAVYIAGAAVVGAVFQMAQ